MPDHVPAPATPLVYYVAQSLDGFVADRDDALDWLLQFGFETFQQHYDEFFAGVGAIIMGASTYRWLAAAGEAWPYPGLPCWVLTHGTLPPMGGAEGVITATDVPAVARAARAAAGDRSVWVVGGGQTAAQFAEHGELDELRVTVMPITLGDGAPLLPHAGPARRWQLAGTTAFDGGPIELAYRAVTDAGVASGDTRDDAASRR